MKKVIYFASLCCAFFSFIHCEKSVTNSSVESSGEEQLVQFNLQNGPEILPFDTRSIPDYYPQEPMTKNEVDQSDNLFSIIEYFVKNTKNDEIIRNYQLTEDNADFGLYIYDKFPLGKYEVYIIAHSVSNHTKEEETLKFNEVKDTFFGKKEFEIQDHYNSISVLDIPLQRIVSKIEFVPTDTIPEEVHSFKIETTGWYSSLQMFTGNAKTQTSNFTSTYSFEEEDRESEENYIHRFFTFVPEGESGSISKVTLTAFDEENNELRKREIPNVPIYKNKITRYTGKLYSTGDDQFKLIIEDDGEWGGKVEIPLED